MLLPLKIPTEPEWQAFLNASTNLEFRQSPSIRYGLLNAFKSGTTTAAELGAFWSDVATAIEQYAGALSEDAGEELPDDEALLSDPHLSEAVGRYLTAQKGGHYQVFLSRVYAAVGLFKLFEARDCDSTQNHLSAAQNVIDAAILEREAWFMRERAHRIVREGQMETAIAATKGKNQKGGNDKNAVNQAWKKEIVAAYAIYKKSLVGKLNKAKAAKELKKKLPHVGVDEITVYRWISAHDTSKPVKPIEHL